MKNIQLTKIEKIKLSILYIIMVFLLLLYMKNLVIFTSKRKSIMQVSNVFESAKKSNEFIYNNTKGILIFKNQNKIINKPKISAVIPVYNSQNTLRNIIFSIINQHLTEFEIILVNDFSSDNTINIIDQLQKKDKRIKLINNKKNMGTLYTRCIGSLYAKGKFIFPLVFINKDTQ